jgi:UDP-N-acetyl-D-mannosaminuronic acid transferase (WecB/TagA/CpsF family)
MTITDSIDRPTTANIVLASETADMAATLRAKLLEEGRPHHVSHSNLEAIVALMRDAGREELVHYAGACYRDDVAWELCLAWLLATQLTESELRCVALAAVGCGGLTAEDIRTANPGMR